MKKKYSAIATAISAAFILAACTQTDVVDDMASMQAENPANNVVSFATYSAKKGTTRAGYLGNMTDKTLKGWEADESKGIEAFEGTGFGVFAYYTGEASDGTYDVYRGNGKNTENSDGGVANFMYNQDVTYVSEGDYWTYDPLKYWPNDFASSAVDGGTPAANGSDTKGNVSFFAYAPYVAAGSGTTGIVDMTAKNAPGDPRIKYTLGANVDLLWGTLDSETGKNVLGQGNAGVGHGTGSQYEQDIIESDKDYKLAADLNKQMVDGKVKFNFIHALAAIGGNDEPDEPTDPDPGESEPTPTLQGGFMVRLALDNKNTGEASDAIDGGDRRPLEDGYQTVVTIEKITIKNTTISAADAGITDGGTEEPGESGTTLGKLTKTAELNLATGDWEREESGTTDSETSTDGDVINQEIGTPAEGTTTDNASRVILNKKIAEYKVAGTTYFSEATSTKDYFTGASKTGNHPGVTEDVQSVYENGSVSPLLFIPGDRPVLKINVVYVVRTYDENLNVQYSKVKNDITKIVVFPEVEMNKHYSLLMQLGLTSVKFDATVSDWEKTTPNGGNNGGQGGEGDGESGNDNNSDADIIIDLPANVKDANGSGE